MSRFDRYLLSQLLVLFGFFALILVAVYWVNRAVILFDQLIADGQSAAVFIEFTILSLPRVIHLVLPVATFAASVYVTNRLSRESELAVMQATGFSPWRLARPVLYYGLIAGFMMAALTHYLVPASLSSLDQKQREITKSVTSRLLTEGTFLHPAPGMTFYIRQITPEGALEGVFLSDRRSPDRISVYTSRQAYLIKDDSGPKLVMVNGLSQVHLLATDQLITTEFADFTYSIGDLIGTENAAHRNIRHVPTIELIRDFKGMAEAMEIDKSWVFAELHSRLNQPIMCLLAAMIGFATLLIGGYSRFGVWRQIAIAFGLLIVMEMLKNTSVGLARRDIALWPLIYAPSVFGLFLTVSLLSSAAHPFLFRRRRAG